MISSSSSSYCCGFEISISSSMISLAFSIRDDFFKQSASSRRFRLHGSHGSHLSTKRTGKTSYGLYERRGAGTQPGGHLYDLHRLKRGFGGGHGAGGGVQARGAGGGHGGHEREFM